MKLFKSLKMANHLLHRSFNTKPIFSALNIATKSFNEHLKHLEEKKLPLFIHNSTGGAMENLITLSLELKIHEYDSNKTISSSEEMPKLIKGLVELTANADKKGAWYYRIEKILFDAHLVYAKYLTDKGDSCGAKEHLDQALASKVTTTEEARKAKVVGKAIEELQEAFTKKLAAEH